MDSDELMRLSKYNKVQLLAIIQNKNEEIASNKEVITRFRETIKMKTREIELLKNPPIPLHKKSLSGILDYFVKVCCIYDDKCIEDDKGIGRAPTNFDEFYFKFKKWCDKNDLVGRVKDINNRNLVKTFIMKLQDESKYGLNIGQKLNECMVNGTKSTLFINIVVKD
tara:strand:- start:68 stop:568 length:501 start_codon:yes stop_codon:yes gene_type:complete